VRVSAPAGYAWLRIGGVDTIEVDAIEPGGGSA
jgi:hypothetical protein